MGCNPTIGGPGASARGQAFPWRIHRQNEPGRLVYTDEARRLVYTPLGFHTKMEMISRRAFGFRNFDNYRLRVRVMCA
jgi:hypothetical protein